MQLKKGEIIELDIIKMAFGGRGIGKLKDDPNGITVFVDKVIYGDRVRASLKRIKPSFLEADLVEVVKESPRRVAPKCPHFGKCGGCQFQFMSYEDQEDMKKQMIVDSFERIGDIQNPPVDDVVAAEDPYFYRNKMEFSFGYDADMNFALGMHLPGRRYDILDLKSCYLQSEKSYKVVNKVREYVLKTKYKPYKYSNGAGFLRSLFLRESKKNDEFMVNLTTSDALPDP